MVLLVGGIGAAVWGYSSAEDMGLTRIVYEEEYREYQAIGVAGIILAAIGAGLAVYGAAAKDSERPRQLPGPPTWVPAQTAYRPYDPNASSVAPGQIAYCAYCGANLVPGSVYCSGCGRLVKK